MKFVRFQKPLTVALTTEIYNDCHDMALEAQVSMAEIVRTILSRYFKNKKKG